MNDVLDEQLFRVLTNVAWKSESGEPKVFVRARDLVQYLSERLKGGVI
jgi:hypothetical protein